MMLRLFVLAYLCLMTSLTMARSAIYQIDAVIFIHHQPVSTDHVTPVLTLDNRHAIPLQTNQDTLSPFYHLLPPTESKLRQEYWTLNHNPNYQVLATYSWRQPSNNQHAIILPSQSRNGWHVEGVVRVRQSNYYLLDAELLFTTQATQPTAFLFSQKQRLKPGTVYYLDHPQAGMLIKVYQVYSQSLTFRQGANE